MAFFQIWYLSDGYLREFNMYIKKHYFLLGAHMPLPQHDIFQKNCKVFGFCKSKCHKNFTKKLDPHKVRWTEAFQKTAGKELTVNN